MRIELLYHRSRESRKIIKLAPAVLFGNLKRKREKKTGKKTPIDSKIEGGERGLRIKNRARTEGFLFYKNIKKKKWSRYPVRKDRQR